MPETKRGTKNPPVQVQTVRGEPYEVHGRRLVPLARIVSLGRARGTIGTHRLEGQGWGAAYVKPLSVIEEAPNGERRRRVAVYDGTTRALLAMVLAAVGFTLLLAAIRWVAHERGQAGQA